MSTNHHPLPERFLPYQEKIKSLREAKEKLDREIAENRQKLADAAQERRELEQSGPPDGENDRKLGEAIVRVQLFTNHQAKLEERAAQTTEEAARTAMAFARELQKLGLDAATHARRKLFAEVLRLVANTEVEVNQSFHGGGIFTPLRSREEVLGEELKANANYRREDGSPFEAFDHLVDTWESFAIGFLALQAVKNEPLVVPA